MIIVTLRNRKESNQDKGILMSLPETVMDIPNRKIDRVIFMLTCFD